MANEDVHKKLCTKPESTVNETIQFAIAHEEGTIREQSYENLERQNMKMEATEVNNNTQTTWRWGPNKKYIGCEGIFTPQHLKDCKAIGDSMKCGKKGHFAKYYQTKGAGNFAESRKVMKPPQKIQRIDEWSESITYWRRWECTFHDVTQNKWKSVQDDGRLAHQ